MTVPRLRPVTFLAVLCVCGCATESEEARYQSNKTYVFLSPRAKAVLSTKDVDQISRVVAHATRKKLYAISAASRRFHPGGFRAIVATPGAISPDQCGSFTIIRDHGEWRVVERFDALSPVLVGLASQDAPDP
jgi:hypothetical protein